MYDENLYDFHNFSLFLSPIPLNRYKMLSSSKHNKFNNITSQTHVITKTVLTKYHLILYLAAFLAVIYILVPLPIISVLYLTILHCLLQMCGR